jgi:hypothetical protein
MIPKDFSELLPVHEGGVTLTHNDFNAYNQSVKRFMDEDDHYDWESDEAKRLAIETAEVWTLQWYPESPISFHSIAAPTLHDLMRIANSDRYK